MGLKALCVCLAFLLPFVLLARPARAEHMEEWLKPIGLDSGWCGVQWPAFPIGTDRWVAIDDVNDGNVSFIWNDLGVDLCSFFIFPPTLSREYQRINSVTVWAWMRDNDTADLNTVRVFLYFGVPISPQECQPVNLVTLTSEAYTNYTATYATACRTTNAWTKDSISTLGVYVQSMDAPDVAMTSLGLTVSYEAVDPNVVPDPTPPPELEVACAFKWPDMNLRCQATERMAYGMIIERAWFVNGRPAGNGTTSLVYALPQPGHSPFQPLNESYRVVYEVTALKLGGGTRGLSAFEDVRVDTLWLWLVYICLFVCVGLWLVDRSVRRTAREAPSEPPSRKEARD